MISSIAKAAKIFGVNEDPDKIFGELAKLEVNHTLRDIDTVILKEGCVVEADSSVTIDPYVVLTGPIFIGKNVHIGPFTFLRGPLYLGDNVFIGAQCEIARSIFLSGSKTTHQNVILDSLVGENTNLGGGTSTANVKVGFCGFPGSRRGAVIGSNANIGAWVRMMPGSEVKDDAEVFGPSVIYKDRVRMMWSPRDKK